MRRGIVRIGVIGTGNWSRRCYLPAFSAFSECVVTTLCGRDTTKLRLLADDFRIQDRLTDYRELIFSDSVDAVVIATPNDQHHSMTMTALEAGKSVLCEKPLALDSSQASEMARRAQIAGVVHMTAFTLRFFPAFRHARALIQAGFVGTPLHVQTAYLHNYVTPFSTRTWYQVRERAGAGALADLGSHAIDQLQWCFGGIRRVSGHLTTHYPPLPREGAHGDVDSANDDVCSFIAELAGGLQANLLVSRVAVGLNTWCEVYGSDAALRWNMRTDGASRIAEVLELQRDGGGCPRVIARDGPFAPGELPSAYREMVSEFVVAIREGRSAEPNFNDGLAAQQVIDAVLKSSDCPHWVSVGS